MPTGNTIQKPFNWNNLTYEQIMAAIRRSVQQEQLKKSVISLQHGLALGGLAAGGSMLLKGLSRRTKPAQSHYTVPISTTVYDAEEQDEAARKRKLLSKQAFLSPIKTDSPRHIQDAAARDKFHIAAILSSLAVGVPLGLYGGRQLGNMMSGIARNRELRNAQQDFEQSLQQYVVPETQEIVQPTGQPAKRRTAPVRKPKVTDVADKRKPKRQTSAKVAQLADNLSKIASDPRLSERAYQLMVAYGLLAPMIGATMGFQSRWRDRDYRKLEIADLANQIERETKNPTFTLMDMHKIPTKTKDKSTEELPEADLLDTGYL